MSEFFCLDFEASGLNMHWSYPIEVGYTNGTIEYDALIKPYPGWDYWSIESQQIHNLSQHEIMFKGAHGAVVCDRMNKDLAGKTVYVDGGQYDSIWCTRLFTASDKVMQFRLDFMTVEMGKAWAEFRKDKFVEHRALADAKALWKFLNDYQQQ